MLGRLLRHAVQAPLRGCGMLVQASARPAGAAQQQQQRLVGAVSALRQQQRQQQRHCQRAASAAGRWQRPQRRHLSALQPGAAQVKAAAPSAAAGEAEEDEEEDEEEEEDADVVGDLLGEGGEDADFLQDLGEDFEEDVGPETSTGGVEWGDKALAVVQQLLAAGGDSGLADVELFSFRAIPSSKRLDIRLDKTTDQYGSPTLDDIATFSRLFNAAYEAAVGEAAAGAVEIEVSSAGAERQVRVPGELSRFAELPMKVEYCSEGDADKVETKVLTFVEHDAAAGVTRWRLADVRANRQAGGKGRGLNRKQRDAVYELPLAALRRVNLHIDF